jgi:hypothetical protein
MGLPQRKACLGASRARPGTVIHELMSLALVGMNMESNSPHPGTVYPASSVLCPTKSPYYGELLYDG